MSGGGGGVGRIRMAQDRDRGRALVDVAVNFRVLWKAGNELLSHQLFKKDSTTYR
jgi:hypothetical protein